MRHEYIANGHPIAYAVEGEVRDWAAYWEDAERGDKIQKEVACLMFPQFPAAGLRWRY